MAKYVAGFFHGVVILACIWLTLMAGASTEESFWRIIMVINVFVGVPTIIFWAYLIIENWNDK